MFGKLFNKADKLFDFATEGKKEYRDAIQAALHNGNFSQENKTYLKSLADKNNLSSKDLFFVHRDACDLLFQKAAADYKITDQEVSTLNSFAGYAGLTFKELGVDLDKLRKYQAIWQIEDLKCLPLFNSDGIPIVFKKSETLAWSTPSTLKKFKKVTTGVSYKGLTASVKIAKGVRYRIGSLDLGRSTKEIVDVEDTGVLWMTNQRIGFIGRKKNFTLVYGKILSFNVNSNGLFIRKEGREAPYIVGMDDYEVPCSIISFVLNEMEQEPIEEIAATSQSASPNNDLLAQLERLGKLREQGIITEEEFLEQKKRILA